MQEFNTLEAYETFIKTSIKPWSAAQRTALTAAMAERWLPAYEAFAAAEDWGDPALLRQALTAVWQTLTTPAAPLNWKRLSSQIHEITPHMDDFDANEALCACVMVQYAIECCQQRDNHTSALMGVLSGLEAVSPDILELESVPARVWRNSAIRKEIEKQLLLIADVQASGPSADFYSALQPLWSDPALAGEVQPRKPSGRVGRSNQELYEQYKAIIQLDIKSAARNLDPRKNPDLAAMLYLGVWMGRYSRRKQMLSGEYGPLTDQTAVTLLLEKNRAADRAVPGMPDWDEQARWTIDVCYQNTYNGLDAAAPDSPHAYGPSLRRLFVQAKQSGLSDAEAWEAVAAWAVYQPEGWGKKSKEDKAKDATLQAHLARPLSWSTTGNPEVPWQTEVDGKTWQVRLNDFPDEPMYTLIVSGEAVGEFHDWPRAWERG